METNFKFSWSMLLFSWLSLVFSILISTKYPELNLIERSGSLMVLFCAIGEYRIMLTHIPLIGAFYVNKHGKEIPSINPINKKENRVSFILRVTIVIGTLIWGYGGLIMKIIW